MLNQGGEREKIHTLEIGGHVQMAKVIPRHKGSLRYRIAHGWKNEYGSFNLEALNFLVHFREPGSSLYAYSYFFLFLIFLLLFFVSFIHSFIFFLVRLSPWKSRTSPLSYLSFIFLNCSPMNSKTAPYLPPPPCLHVARPRAKRQ
jgi:hypothetical protein